MNARVPLTISTVLFLMPSFSVFGQSTPPPNDDIPIITVCEALKDLARFDGKLVVIVGRFAFTFEGGFLTQDCEHKIMTDGYTWANLISTTYIPQMTKSPPPDLPKTFRWDENRLNAKLKEVQKTTELQDHSESAFGDRWVAMFGRFETRVPLRVTKYPSGFVRGVGFGNLGAAPAQLLSPETGYHELKGK